MRKVSAISMITVSPRRRRLGCYHLLQPDVSIDETLIVAVLRQMRRHFRRPLIVLWDRLQAHRSAYLREYPAETSDVHVEYFPPYAPELNPVEYLWTDSKNPRLGSILSLQRRRTHQQRSRRVDQQIQRPTPPCRIHPKVRTATATQNQTTPLTTLISI